MYIVSSQWPAGALVFELVASPLEQIKTGSMHFSLMSENPYIYVLCVRTFFCSGSGAPESGFQASEN